MSQEVIPANMSKDKARILTDKIKGRSEELWYLLLDAYNGGAHTALGYSSWGEYFEKEFGGHGSRAYQLLEAGRAAKALESHSKILERPNESQSRELAPLAKTSPEEAAEVWAEVVEEYQDTDKKITAKVIQDKVQKRAFEVEQDNHPLVQELPFLRYQNYGYAQTYQLDAMKQRLDAMAPDEREDAIWRIDPKGGDDADFTFFLWSGRAIKDSLEEVTIEKVCPTCNGKGKVVITERR